MYLMINNSQFQIHHMYVICRDGNNVLKHFLLFIAAVEKFWWQTMQKAFYSLLDCSVSGLCDENRCWQPLETLLIMIIDFICSFSFFFVDSFSNQHWYNQVKRIDRSLNELRTWNFSHWKLCVCNVSVNKPNVN